MHESSTRSHRNLALRSLYCRSFSFRVFPSSRLSSASHRSSPASHNVSFNMATATQALPASRSWSDVNPWLVAIAVMTSTFMEVLDTTVVNVSLPHIAGSLSATPDEATWALTSYLVANAIVLPMTGWLANFFGRKRLLLASVIGFTA